MKTLLIIDANLGQVRAYMAKTLLGTAAREARLGITDNPNDVEMAIVLGDFISNDSALNGRNARLDDISRAVAHPELFLSEAKGHAKPYTAPVATATPVAIGGPKCVVAVITYPTGVVHTFMVTEAIETEAKKRGWQVKVETRSSAGAGNAITPEEVAVMGLVTVTADIEVDLTEFAGRPMYHTSTGPAPKEAAQELDKTVVEVAPYELADGTQTATTEGKKESAGACRHLLTGVSYMLPMVVAGGLCIALSFAFSIGAFKESGTLAAALMQIGGGSAFALMVPVLAGHVTFSIADRPGLTPGLIGGMLVVSTSFGFIGGIIAGFLAGYATKLVSMQLKLPQSMEVLKPILIISLISSLVVGLAMIYLIDKPVVGALGGLAHWLQTMETASVVLLGAILGSMICADMGGPINRAAYAFGAGLLNTQIYDPMAAIMAAGMVPPLVISLAIMVVRHKFDRVQQEDGKTALVFGLRFIPEGAIPFAAHDPIRMLPCCIIGEVLADAVSMAIGAELMVPHGSLFVLLIPGAITPVLDYLVAITAGTLVAGLAYAFLEHPKT